MKTENRYKSEIIDSILKEVTPNLKKKVSSKMKIAIRIDEERIKRGWTKLELAQAFNKNPSEITKWLSGVHNFTIDTLIDIETVLNIDILSICDNRERAIVKYTAVTDNILTTDVAVQSCNYLISGPNSTHYSFIISEKSHLAPKIWQKVKR